METSKHFSATQLSSFFRAYFTSKKRVRALLRVFIIPAGFSTNWIAWTGFLYNFILFEEKNRT